MLRRLTKCSLTFFEIKYMEQSYNLCLFYFPDFYFSEPALVGPFKKNRIIFSGYQVVPSQSVNVIKLNPPHFPFNLGFKYLSFIRKHLLYI